jgi:hypothetical protein
MAVVVELDGCDFPVGAEPASALLAAMDLPVALAADVATVAVAYQPHCDATAEADAPFGRGPHRCPGEAVARRLTDAALASS